ncbi:HAD family hydrolase [Mumia flava]|uniref:HAD family hydrolase n=1 Tax=Mumia flava TaxID=1348852 RepID=UPI001476BB66|nr:HAD family hydrolase [Mumia flava]
MTTTDLPPTLRPPADPHSPRPADEDASLVPPALAVRPEVLLLDFGGVVFETRKRPEGMTDAAALVADVLGRAGHAVAVDDIAESMRAGTKALTHWKHAMGRTQRPAELTHRMLWEEFLLADQSEPVRATAAAAGARLMELINPLLNDHLVRDGAEDLLRTAREAGIRVGIVSNAHAGRAHRRLMREHGLERFVAVQLYSDEVGVRKPNPEMIERAARALGSVPQHCWYVGDTQDRDVQAGRRAGVGAVLLTRSKHTDAPPFGVRDTADLVVDAPADLVAVLREAAPRGPSTGGPDAGGPDATAATAPPSAPAAAPRRRPRALLLDQGGVLTTSEKRTDGLAALARETAARLRAAGHQVPDLAMADALARGREAYAEHKAAETDTVDRTPVAYEVDARTFWGEMVAPGFDAGARSWLLAEAEDLNHRYARAKSTARLRDGVADLLRWCRANDVKVGVVSNTICGRSGRERLERAGVADLIGVHLYSDEVGRRKPDPAIVAEAVRALDVDPADCWFVGDKPWRDVAAARAAGVGTTVVVRGGAPDGDALAASLGEHRPDLLLASMTDVHDALRSAADAP